MAKRDYSDQEKAAVLAALLVGQSVSSVAKEYKIPKGTVSAWLKREQEKINAVRQDAAKQLSGGQAQTEFGDKLAKYMMASVDSLTSQVEVMGEKEYLRKQDMHQVAVGHGVQMDKLIRLLEASNRAEPQSDTAED